MSLQSNTMKHTNDSINDNYVHKQNNKQNEGKIIDEEEEEEYHDILENIETNKSIDDNSVRK
jgi:hypothetical protein